MLKLNDVMKIVDDINKDLYSIMGDLVTGDLFFDYYLSARSNGYIILVYFMDEVIWCDDNDERICYEDSDEREPLRNFLLRSLADYTNMMNVVGKSVNKLIRDDFNK